MKSTVCLRTLAAIFSLLAHLLQGQAQDWQFSFDPNGNLLAQGTATSAPPQIIGQLKDRIISPGETISFSVVAADTRGLTYQWQFNGVGIAGATNDNLLIRNVRTLDEGEYRVILTNPSGSLTSPSAFLLIDSDGDSLPDSWERLHFSNLSQNATADFDKDGVTNIREFFEKTIPTNPASARWALTVLTDGDGFVNVSPSGPSYTNGQSLSLTAMPSGSNRFYGWTGAARMTNNPLALTITNNTTLRAHFNFLPLEIVWTNGAGGDWHAAANWSPNQIPGASDNVIIPMTATVAIDSAAECRDLTLGGVSGNPTITGTGSLRILRTLQWALGTMSGSGLTLLETNATANISKTVTVASRTFENRGSVLVYNSGGLFLTGGAVFTNGPGALFQVVSETCSLGGSANGRFDNSGAFVRSSGTGTLIINSGISFNHSGTLQIQSGLLLCEGRFRNLGAVDISSEATLRLAADGSATGSFTASAGGLVEWTRGEFILNSGLRLEGDGEYRINAGTVLVNADLAIQRVDLRTGTLGGSGLLTILDSMNWTGGSMIGEGRTLIAPGATLNAALLRGGNLNGRTLENGGTVRWTGAGNIGFVNAVITNRAGALFQDDGNGGFAFVSGANRFDNLGTFRKSGSEDTLEISGGGSFNNHGKLELLTGTLLCKAPLTHSGIFELSSGTTNRLAGGGSATGIFQVPTDALMEWAGGTFLLNPGAKLNGPGSYRLNGISAIVVGDGDLEVDRLDLVNGSSSWRGIGTLTIKSAMRWTAGSMEGTGRTIIGPQGALFIANPNSVGLQRTLENAGSIEWTGPGLIGLLNGVITNRPGALFQTPDAGRIAYSGGSSRFDNAGTFRKAGPSGTLAIDAGMPFINTGTVDLRGGLLSANGGFVSSGSSVLRLGVGGVVPGKGHAQLQLTRPVQLAGALEIDILPGYAPAVRDAWVVVNASSRTGTFEKLLYPSQSVTLEISNTPNSVVVLVKEVVSTVPSPEFLPTSLSGEDLLLTWTSKSNLTYRLEFVADLSQPPPASWIPIPGDVLATGPTASKLDPLTASNRFYRVRVLP